jgi:hypothetical protein
VTITIQVHSYVECHSTEDKPVASDLEIDWRDGDISAAYLSCGNCYCQIEFNALVWHLLGGEIAGRKLIASLIEEELTAS